MGSAASAKTTSRSHRAYFVKCTNCFLPEGAAHRSPLASFGARRTGLAGRDPATPGTFRRPPSWCRTSSPFLDGNGRLWRLLITLSLCSDGVLQEPSLYLSLYFKRNRETYYDLLQRVRTEGAWEAWLDFFLEGVRETSQQAHATARSLVRLFDQDRARVETLGRMEDLQRLGIVTEVTGKARGRIWL